MNIELYIELDNCIYYCQKLRMSMERDMEAVSRALKGEIYTAYEKNTRDVMEALDKLKKQMLMLQEEQLL